MKREKQRGAERLEERNLLAADVGLNEDLFLPPPPTGELEPPAVVQQARPLGQGTPPPRPGAPRPPRPGRPPQPAPAPLESRNIEGTENNLDDPTLGSVDTPLLRITTVEYADGISEPAGTDRPSAREISNVVADQTTTEPNDRFLTDITWLWGQFIDHDIDLTENADPAESFNIEVPEGDMYFDPDSTGEEVIGLNRSVYDPDTGTSIADPREQINQITAFLDGSVIYGSDEERAAELRTFEGGLLATSEGDLLPFNEAGLSNAGGPSDSLFLAGDVRANENAALTAMQTLWVREHNYWAAELASENPSLTDEEIYQAAKAIVVGELQVITYNEFLPALLGEDALSAYAGYDSAVDPSISNVFSTASYRFGHSMLSSELLRLENDGTTADEGNLSLLNSFFAPGEIVDNGIDSLLLGATAQLASEIDTQVVDDVRNFLFGDPGDGGFDLVSLNIQRGRDHGLADYNQVREDLGLERVTEFSDITSDPELAAKLEALYGDVDNIDVWVGALAEDHVAGSSMGELNQAVIVDQFERLRDGDRLWYENVFSGPQLAEIENTSLSDVIERNTDITGLRENVFFDESVFIIDLADQGGSANGVLVVGDTQVEWVDPRSGEVLESRAIDEVSQIQIVGSERHSNHVTPISIAAEIAGPGTNPDRGLQQMGNVVDLFGTDGADSVVVDGNQVTINGMTIVYSNIDLFRWHSGAVEDSLEMAASGDARFVVVDGPQQPHRELPHSNSGVDEAFSDLGESQLPGQLKHDLFARRNR